MKQKVNVHFVQEKFPEKNYGQYTFPEGIYDAVRNRSGGSKRAQLVVCHVPRSMRNKRWQGKDQQYSKKKDGETFREKNDQKNNKR